MAGCPRRPTRAIEKTYTEFIHKEAILDGFILVTARFHSAIVEQKMSSADSELLKEAIYRDDAAAVKRLADSGVDLEYEYYWMHPIHAACFAGRLDAIRALAEKGANLDVIGLRDMPPISVAVQDRRIEVATVLLELGANADVRDATPLHDAPLHIALWRQRSLEAARLLIEFGADVFVEDWTGNSALRRAVFFECDDIVKLMAERHGRKAKEAITKAKRDLELIEAARRNSESEVNEALAKGANVNVLNPQGMSALRLAARLGNSRLVRLLLRKGADVQLRVEYEQKTALLEAADEGHRDIVDLLLEAGADLLDEYIPGEQLAGGRDLDAVAFARESGHMELYEYLLASRTELRKLRKKQEREAAKKEPGKNKAGARSASKENVTKKKGNKKTTKRKTTRNSRTAGSKKKAKPKPKRK